MKIIYSGSRQISWPIRHTNGQDYLFSSGQQNSNIHLYNWSTKTQQVIADASVDDRLAIFSHHQELAQQKIAYVSLASGSEEIWLTEINNGSSKKLTQFNDSRHYVDLKVVA